MTNDAADTRGLPVGAQGFDASGAWAMLMLILTEATFFAFLLFSYFYTASGARGAWPPPGPPELRLALPNTVVLLASSAVLAWGERGIRAGRAGRLRAGLLGAFVLGALFLGIQMVEYGRKSFGPTEGAYGSLFYTITGFHAAHVAVGLLMLAVVHFWAALGRFDRGRHLAVTNVAWYWHFVDAVWLAVFGALYLAPRWTG